MAVRRNHLGAGERAVPPLHGKGVGCGQHHLCGEKGYLGPACRGQRVTLGWYQLGGAVRLIGQYYWPETRVTSRRYYPESKGSRQGASGWAPSLVRTESLGRFRRLVRNIPLEEGRSDSAGPTNRRSSGVWHLDLLLGDLGRYHSFPGQGEAETAEV